MNNYIWKTLIRVSAGVIIAAVLITLTVRMITKNTDKKNISPTSSGALTVDISAEYRHLKFKDLPEKWTMLIGLADGLPISITGYIPTNVSTDYSTAYLWNNGFFTVPSSEEDYGKGVVVCLDISNISSYKPLQGTSKLTGDCFATVYGVVRPTQRTDVFGVTSQWYIQVTTIEEVEKLPKNIEQYNEFLGSFEWEALADTIDYTGAVLYEWYNDEELLLPTSPMPEYKWLDALDGARDNYPEIYGMIDDYLSDVDEVYNTIKENIAANARPDNVDELYSQMLSTYSSMVEVLNNLGYFE